MRVLFVKSFLEKVEGVISKRGSLHETRVIVTRRSRSRENVLLKEWGPRHNGAPIRIRIRIRYPNLIKKNN